jgi:hypothetical protein
MYKDIIVVLEHQRSLPQPAQQNVAVLGVENAKYGIARTRLGNAKVATQEVEIVVPEHHVDDVAVVVGPAEHLETLRTAIDEITYKPEPVSVFLKVHATHPRFERIETSLYVTNDPRSHRKSCKIYRLEPSSSMRDSIGGQCLIEIIIEVFELLKAD